MLIRPVTISASGSNIGLKTLVILRMPSSERDVWRLKSACIAPGGVDVGDIPFDGGVFLMCHIAGRRRSARRRTHPRIRRTFFLFFRIL